MWKYGYLLKISSICDTSYSVSEKTVFNQFKFKLIDHFPVLNLSCLSQLCIKGKTRGHIMVGREKKRGGQGGIELNSVLPAGWFYQMQSDI